MVRKQAQVHLANSGVLDLMHGNERNKTGRYSIQATKSGYVIMVFKITDIHVGVLCYNVTGPAATLSFPINAEKHGT